jgi:hypothetical protein
MTTCVFEMALTVGFGIPAYQNFDRNNGVHRSLKKLFGGACSVLPKHMDFSAVDMS